MSSAVAPPRYAWFVRRFTIPAAHVSSSFPFDGRQLKILRRLTVSDTPVTCEGPRIVMSRMCVSAVGRKDVDARDAAARTDGRAVDLAHLRSEPSDLVGGRRRARVAIADGEPADLARRAQVPFEQRRRKRLLVGYVVEAAADGVGREIRGDVDVDAKKIANSTLIFRAVQPLKRTPAGIRLERRRGVDRVLERLVERLNRRRVGTPGLRRRHHPGPPLADHLLGDVLVPDDFGRVQRGERQSAGPCLVAVARRAVLTDQLILRFDRQSGRRMRGRQLRRRWRRRPGASGRRGGLARSHTERHDGRGEARYDEGLHYRPKYTETLALSVQFVV